MSRIIPVAIWMLVAAIGPAAWAQDKALKDFFGEWIGTGKAKDGAAKTQDRDSVVTIERLTDGFKITWSTMRAQQDSPTASVVKSTSLKFKGTANPKVFHALDNGDPVKGAPSAWATLDGSTLKIQILSVEPDGNWTVQVYERTLTSSNTMDTRFRRITNGEVTRKAELKFNKTP